MASKVQYLEKTPNVKSNINHFLTILIEPKYHTTATSIPYFPNTYAVVPLLNQSIIQPTQAPYGPQGQFASLKLVACT
jgi:hypothetical protein